MKNLSLLFILSVLICGSGSFKSTASKEQEVLESWMGHTIAEIIRSWDPPIRTNGEGQGEEILVNERTTYVGGALMTRQTNIYINKKEAIYYYLAKGRYGN